MAIAYVAQRGILGVSLPAGNQSISLINPTLITPGNTLFLLVSVQNATTAGDPPPIANGAVVTDPRGNAWVYEGAISSSDGGANHGQTVQIYRCLVLASYLAADAISLPSTIAGRIGLFEIQEFSGISQGVHAVYSAANKGVSTTTAAQLPIQVSAAGQLVLIAGTVGSSNAVTTDADTLDGSWSGALPATSTPPTMGLWESHKILTGFTSATQNYGATWTSAGGDNSYAQLAMVYDPLSPNGSPITQQFPPQDDPNYGCPDSGFEPMPTGSALVPIDTGTAYQIEHTLPPYSFGTHNYSAVTQYDDTESAIQQHHVAYDLFQKGAEAPQDAITQLTFPVSSVSLGAGATVLKGSDTWLTGTGAPAGGLGVIGNYYVDLTAAIYYLKTGVATWTAQGSFVGDPRVLALQSAGGYYLKLNGTPQVAGTFSPHASCRFDLYATGGSQYNILNYANSRIVRIGIRFLGWKDDSSDTAVPVGEGIQCNYVPSIGTPTQIYEVEMGAWLTPDYQRSASEQIRWMGETNPLPRIPNSVSYYGSGGYAWFRTTPDSGVSWTYQNMLNLAFDATSVNPSGSDLIRIWGLPGAAFSQTTVYLDKLELVVEVAPERRLGNVVHNISTAPQYASGPLPFGSYSPGRAAIPVMRSVLNESIPLTVTGSPNDYVLSAREALPASSSDYYPALAAAPAAPNVGGILLSTLSPNIPPNLPQGNGVQLFSPHEAVGPSLAFLGYTQPRPMSPNQRSLVQRTVVDGMFASDTSAVLQQYSLSFGALDGGNSLVAGSLFPVFRGVAPLSYRQVYTGHNQTQRFYDSAGATYDAMRVVVKPDPLTTAALTVAVAGGGAATISVAGVLANGEQIGNGWYSYVVAMSVSHAGTGVATTSTFSSTTPMSAPWQIASVMPIGNSQITTFEPLLGSASSPVTYAYILECTMAAPIAVLGTSTITMDPVDKAICRSSAYDVPNINISNSATFDRLIVERSIDSGANWIVALRVVDPGVNITLIDEECPWDVGGAISVTYRVTGYRDSDRRSTSVTTGAWSGFSANPGAAFGLSSNEAGFSVAYVPADPNQVQVTWNPLNPVTTVPLHGQDYQYALRIPENRGLSVTVAVLVDNITYCCMPTVSEAVLYDDAIALYDDPIVAYDGGAEAGACAAAQTSSLTNYGELLSKGGGSMSPRPYERDILNVFNSSALWELKLPGGHTRFVTAQVGAMAITPAAGLYMAELTLTDITPPSADPYDE